MIENQEKRQKYGNQRDFLHKSQYNRWFRTGIHSWLSCRADAYFFWPPCPYIRYCIFVFVIHSIHEFIHFIWWSSNKV